MERFPCSASLGFVASLAAASCNAPDARDLFTRLDPASVLIDAGPEPSASAPAGRGGSSGSASTSAGDGALGGGEAASGDVPPDGAGSEPARGAPLGDGGASASDAPPTVSGESSPPAPSPDAGASEAPTPDAGSALPAGGEPPACGGAPLGGSCWYLGELAQTCDDVCAESGGVDPAALGVIGTPAQGGSVEGCAAVLQALGALTGSVTAGFREDGLGFGCHVFVEAGGAATAWWLTAPDLSPAASSPSVRRACGCAG